MGEKRYYFHGSSDESFQGVDENLCSFGFPFGGVFTLIEEAPSFGKYLYRCEMDEDDILDSVFDIDYSIIKTAIAAGTKLEEENDEEIQEMWDYLHTEESFPDHLISFLWEQDTPDWENQRLRGMIAYAAGYKAVTTQDEFGTSYLVVSKDVKFERVDSVYCPECLYMYCDEDCSHYR